MKFNCHRDTILNEISIAQDIISTRNSLSILSNVYLHVEDNTLTVKATDLKVGFEGKIPVECIEPGTTTVFCDKFLGILRTLPDDEIMFSLEDNQLDIKPQKTRIDFQLKCITPEDFPELSDINNDKLFEIPQVDFSKMIHQTIFAVSVDETRYFMNGVFLEQEENGIIMVSTDGKRLSFIKKSIETPINFEKSIIIPPKILNLCLKLGSSEGNMLLGIADKKIFIKIGQRKINSNLIDGEFPNYKRVIPESQEYSITIEREHFLSALNRVSLLAENKSRRIFFELKEGILAIRSEENDIGSALEEIDCSYSGPDARIALNYVFLLEPLKVVNSKTVLIEYSDPNKAISIFSEPKEDFFHIVMPMQYD